MIGKNVERTNIYETNLYEREPLRDVSADSRVGYKLDRGWFAEQRLARPRPATKESVTKNLDLTLEEADWFATR